MPPKISPNAHVATAGFTNVFNAQNDFHAKQGINALAAALCTAGEGESITAPAYFAPDGTTVRPSVETALGGQNGGYQKGLRAAVAASGLTEDRQATLTACIGLRANPHVATVGFTNVFDAQKDLNAKHGINALAAALCTAGEGESITAPEYFAPDGTTVRPSVETALGGQDAGYQKGLRAAVAASGLTEDQQATLTACIGLRANPHVATAGFTNVFDAQKNLHAKHGINALAAALCTAGEGESITAPAYFAPDGTTVRPSVETALGGQHAGYQKGLRAAVAASGLTEDQQATLTACIGLRANAHVATVGFTNVFDAQKNLHAKQGINALAAALCTAGEGESITAPAYFAPDGTTVRPSVETALGGQDAGYQKGLRAAVAASGLTEDQQATLTACIGLRANPHVATVGFTNVFNAQKNLHAKHGINALAAALCTAGEGESITAPAYFAPDGTTVRPSVETALGGQDAGYQKGLRAAVAASGLTEDQQATLTACIGLKRTKPTRATLAGVPSSGIDGSVIQGPEAGSSRAPGTREHAAAQGSEHGAGYAPPLGPPVLFSVPAAPLSENDARMAYASLQPGHYVDGDVIADRFRAWNAYNAAYPAAPGEETVYFVTPDEIQSLAPDYNPQTLDMASDVLSRRQEPLLILPIHHPGNHWTIATYDRRSGEAHHADSLRTDRYGTGENPGTQHDAHAQTVLGNIYARDPYQGRNPLTQGTFFLEVVQEQPNDTDCGLYVLGRAAQAQYRRNGLTVDNVPFSRETLRDDFALRYPHALQPTHAAPAFSQASGAPTTAAGYGAPGGSGSAGFMGYGAPASVSGFSQGSGAAPPPSSLGTGSSGKRRFEGEHPYRPYPGFSPPDDELVTHPPSSHSGRAPYPGREQMTTQQNVGEFATLIDAYRLLRNTQPPLLGSSHGGPAGTQADAFAPSAAENPHYAPLPVPPPTMPSYAPYPTQTGLNAPPPQTQGISGRLYPFTGTSGDTPHRFVLNGGTYADDRVIANFAESDSLGAGSLLQDLSSGFGYAPATQYPDGRVEIDHHTWQSQLSSGAPRLNLSNVAQDASAQSYQQPQYQGQGR